MTLAGDVRAFVAACRKELRIVRRYPAMLFGMLFWPVLLPAAWILVGQTYSGGDAAAVAAFAERAGTAEIAGFVFVGYAMYMWLSMLLWGPGTSLRQEQLRGSLEAVFLTPATRLVPLFAPPVAHLPVTVLTLVIMTAAMRLFGVAITPEGILRALVVIVMAVPVMYAIGSLFATAVLRLGETGPIVHFVRGVFVLACGVSFPVAMLPEWAQAAARALPPTYVVADVRAVLLARSGLGTIALDLAFLIGSAAVVAVAASFLFRVLERSARRSGMLGRY